MDHYAVKVEDQPEGELWRCAVCGEEHILPADMPDKVAEFNSHSDCIGYNPAPG